MAREASRGPACFHGRARQRAHDCGSHGRSREESAGETRRKRGPVRGRGLPGPPGLLALRVRAAAEMGYELNRRHEYDGENELGFRHGCESTRRGSAVDVRASSCPLYGRYN